MSKKMLKRSLALGALMAFVITGQAWAAGKDYGVNNDAANLDNREVSITSSELVDLGDVTFNTNTGIHSIGIQGINSNKIVNLKAGALTLNTEENGITIQYDGQVKLAIEKSLTINAGGIGISSGPPQLSDGFVEITGQNAIVTITASENAVWAREQNSTIKVNVATFKAESLNYNSEKPERGYAILADGLESKVNITTTGNVDLDGVTGAIKATNNSTVDVIGNSIDIDVISNNPDSYVDAVRAGISNVRTNDNGIVNLTATKDINIDISGQYVSGIIARGQYGAGYGEKDTDNVQVSQGGIVTVNAENLNITANGSESGIGIWASNGTTNADVSKVASVTVNAKNTTINATTSAISNHSQGVITINNNLSATAPYVLDTRGDAITNINTDGKGVVNLTGDILFGYATNSGTKIDAKVDLVLTDGSLFEGKIVKDISAMSVENQAKPEMTTVNGMKLSLNKGATWNLTGASIVNDATFGADSKLEIDGATFEESNNVYALNGTGSKDTLTIEKGAKLVVNNIDEKTYNIATGFETVSTDKWDIDNLNALMEGEWKETNGLQLVVSAKEVNEIASDTGISESTATLVESIIQNANTEAAKVEGSPEKAAVDFINNVVANNPTSEAVGEAINSATKMAEAGGNSATAANIVKNVTGVTNDRLSFNCGHSAPHKGGHGVGLFEEGSGADIWVEYVHGKDKVEDMPSTAGATSYEGQFNGFVMGVDFKKVNKFQSGVAFNYGEGDTNSVGGVARTHSDYDFWGVGYYGNIHNDDSNVIFDINYAKTDSDVTQSNSGSTFEASPETTTWSAGVKLEKLYQNENVQIVPYTGLRYMSIDSDDYSTSGGEFNYSMERQDIWLLPLGVSIRQEIANDNGWTVSPRVDLSYIWAFGDTNSNMEVKSPFSGVSQLGYDVMDDGSFLGLVGVEAHKGQWGYGVSYSYQKGDHSESKKWYVDVNYSF